MRGLAAAAVLAACVGLAGCSSYNSNPSFFRLHVKNDTPRTVTVLVPGIPGSAEVARHAGIDMSAWHSDASGVALVRVLSGGKTLGCLTVHYDNGEAGASVRVSAATPCASATHHGASHWIGVAVIVAAVLVLLLFLGARLLRRISPAAAERFEAGMRFRSSGAQSRVPAEWRVPIAFVVIWVVPPLVAFIHPAWWGGTDAGTRG
jgi:hypothetical protein